MLVVDDSSFMRRTITEIIAATGEFQVVGTARNGLDALKQVTSLHPDIVTLDVEMPELDGIQALERIMREAPRPVVMLGAATTAHGQDLTLRALELGALDFVRKPSGPISVDLARVSDRLLGALRAAREANLRQLKAPRGAAPREAPVRAADRHRGRHLPPAGLLPRLHAGAGRPPARRRSEDG